jgi:hypothetical protein
MRRARGYHDVIGLFEFAEDAYVITPFTSDYDSILLSTSLSAEETEFARFPSGGTNIVMAIERSLDLFDAFNFLNASGNLIVVFSDGRDFHASTLYYRGLRDVITQATEAHIPIHFIRTAYGKEFGTIGADELWKSVTEETGGHFFVGSDEATIARALEEVDRLSPGTIDIDEYARPISRFAGFALFAVACWDSDDWTEAHCSDVPEISVTN